MEAGEAFHSRGYTGSTITRADSEQGWVARTPVCHRRLVLGFGISTGIDPWLCSALENILSGKIYLVVNYSIKFEWLVIFVNISIILRTKNEGKSLGETLALLRRQVYAPRPELIVVDSGSTDDTLAIAVREADLRVITIPPAEFTYGRSLNIGIRAARGDIVVALSAHAFPLGEHWLSRLVDPFCEPRVAGVYGRQVPREDAWPSVKRDYLEFYGSQRNIQTDPANPGDHCFSNAASALRRSLWEQHPFDETLPYCEDWEWARAMLERGYVIVYEPEASVYHSHNEPLTSVYRRCRQEMLAKKQLYKRQIRSEANWCRTWMRSVAADLSFIQKSGGDKAGLCRILAYRLFWAFGRSSSFLPWSKTV